MRYKYFGGLSNNKDRGKECEIIDKKEDGWCFVQFFHRDGGVAMVQEGNLKLIEEEDENALDLL